jgi:acyl-CoA dehydrogenase
MYESTPVAGGRRQGVIRGQSRPIFCEVAARHAEEVDAFARFPREAIDSLREGRLLGVGIPAALGGGGAGLVELSVFCELLGRYCASTAMIYAMHLIQVACIVRHHRGSPELLDYLRELSETQGLVASVTSEVGVGGDIRSSVAGLAHIDGRVTTHKEATTISYGEYADALLLTARRTGAAAANDQVLVLLRKEDFSLEKTGTWDTLGMRGTCSPGFRVTVNAPAAQVLPVPFADIASETMVPFSHVLWSSCWLGIATAAVARARSSVRKQARAQPGSLPSGALRLAELASLLQLMRAGVRDVARECGELMNLPRGSPELTSISLALRLNNLKVSSSDLLARIAQQALQVCGVGGYKNDSPSSMGRILRDALSAPLMVGNDRILATNASLLMVLKDD